MGYRLPMPTCRARLADSGIVVYGELRGKIRLNQFLGRSGAGVEHCLRGDNEFVNEKPMPEVALDPDPVIEAYKKDVDRTLLRENLKLTPEQRVEKLIAFQRFLEEWREAGRRAFR